MSLPKTCCSSPISSMTFDMPGQTLLPIEKSPLPTLRLLVDKRPHRAVLRLEQLPERDGALGIARQVPDQRLGQLVEHAAHRLQVRRQVVVGEKLKHSFFHRVSLG